MSITTQQLLDTFPQLLQLFKGSTNITFHDVSSPTNIKPNTIVFINEVKYLESAANSEASVLVVGAKIKSQTEKIETSKTVLISTNPTLAMAFTIDKFFLPKRLKPAGIHPSAIIPSTTKIGKNVAIGPFCVVGERTNIGDNTVIQSNVTIEEDVSIGADCQIMSNVFIGYKSMIGDRVEIKPGAVIASEGFGFTPDQTGKFHRITQRGIVVLENDVSIGAGTSIDRATFDETRICEGTKLDNKIHVGHNCYIGKHGVLSGGSVLAGSSILGNHVMLGGHSAVGGHLTVGDKVQIGGMSGFQTDVMKPGAYAGRPLLPLKEHLRSQLLLSKLGSLFKDVKRIKKQLGINYQESEQESES